MCDMLSLSLASTAIGAAGSIASGMSAASAARKQAANIHQWQQEQKKFRMQEQQRQEDYRKEAEAAQQAGLAQVSADQQKQRQGAEETRLGNYLQGKGEASNQSGTVPVAAADTAMLSGQQGQNAPVEDTGSGDTFKTDLAKKINEATTDAQQRTKAMATIGSFGESFGGLGTDNPLLQQATGNAIDRQNEFRRGSLGAFNVERAIDPVQVTATQSPIESVFPALLSMGTQGLGSSLGKGGGWGSLFSSAAKTDPWAGARIGKNTVGLF